MNTTTFCTPVPADLAVARLHVAPWPANAGATGLSAFTARRIEVAVTTAMSTSAGKSATRKDATGDEAFEDPL